MAAKKHVDLSEEVEAIAADRKLKLLGLPSNPLLPHKYQPMRLSRFMKIPNTKPARGLEKFDPFHSVHHEHPQFKGTVPFWWWWWSRTSKGAHKMGWYFRRTCREEQEKDARPWLKSTQRWNKIAVFDQCEQKASQKIQKTVGSSFITKHSYAYHLRNIETGETVAWYQNLKSPWFDKMAEAKKWLEKKEEKRD